MGLHIFADIMPRGLTNPCSPAKSAGRNKAVPIYEEKWLLQIEHLIIKIGTYHSLRHTHVWKGSSMQAVEVFAEKFCRH